MKSKNKNWWATFCLKVGRFFVILNQSFYHGEKDESSRFHPKKQEAARSQKDEWQSHDLRQTAG
jgi:hypothetical protein